MDGTAETGLAITLQLFDGFRLEVGGAGRRTVVDLAEGPQRLVALLALRGRVGRCRAAATLWPDADPARAMARLRTQIWRVNQCLADLVVAEGGRLALRAGVDCDVRRLAALAGATEAGAGPGDSPETTADDLALWSPEPSSGELLPDWDDDWLDDERERLRQLRLHALEAVAGRLAAAGRFGPAVDLALSVLRGDPLRESAHRVLIRVHLAEGNVVEARRAYRRCAVLLERELGVAPSRLTVALLHPGLPYRQPAVASAS